MPRANFVVPVLRLQVAPSTFTPSLKVRMEHLQRLVDTNPPLHNLHCLFPDVCRVMGNEYYISKTDTGMTVSKLGVHGQALAVIQPRQE